MTTQPESLFDTPEDAGMAGLAPEGVDAMRFEFEGTIIEVPATDIGYLAAWWRVPCPEFAWPTIADVRIGGRWTRETRRG